MADLSHSHSTSVSARRFALPASLSASLSGLAAGTCVAMMDAFASRPLYTDATGFQVDWGLFREAAATSVALVGVLAAVLATFLRVAIELLPMPARRLSRPETNLVIALVLGNSGAVLLGAAAAYDPFGLFAGGAPQIGGGVPGLAGRVFFGVGWNVLVICVWAALRRRRRLGRIAAAAGTALCLATLGGAVWIVYHAASVAPELARATGDPRAGPGRDRPNVLFVVLDTLRADHVSCYGGPAGTTPNLDRFASDATRFDNAVAAAGWTPPSHATMFTGLHVPQHGMTVRNGALPEEAVTLAELLSQSGYQTAGASANPNCSAATGLAQGFDTWDDLIASPSIPFVDYTLAGRINRLLRDAWGPSVAPARLLPTLERDKGAIRVVQSLLGWFADRYDARRPFFVFANLFEAHWPYRAPLWARRLFLNDAELRRSYRVDGTRLVTPSGLPPQMTDPRIVRKLYQAAVRYQDEQLQVLLSLLRETGLLDSTLVVVVVSDHGEHLGEHGLWGHEQGAYQTIAHVPLIVRYPGKFASGGRVGQLVEGADLFGTVLSVCGVELASPLQLQLPFRDLSDPDARDRWPDVAVTDFGDSRTWPSWGYRRGRWKYIKGDTHSAQPHQLFDLFEDPAELNDRWRRDAERTRKMPEELRQWLAVRRERSLAATRPGPRPTTQQRRRMHDLGYVQ